jgi:competence protein ComEC
MRNLSRNRKNPEKVSKLPLIILLFVLIAFLYLFISFLSSEHKTGVMSNAVSESTADAPGNAAGTGADTAETAEGPGPDAAESGPDAEEPSSEPLTFSFVDPATLESLSQSLSSSQEEPADPAVKEFKVYFLNVGQGDSSLIICDGHTMLIDGGPSSQSDTVYSFLETRSISHLDYIVATHPDEDHIGGLAGALNYATVGKALSSVLSDDSESYLNFIKYLDKQGVKPMVPAAGDVFSLGSATVTVLGPINPGNTDNNNSLVLRVVHGNSSFLFTGDAEAEEETDILKSGMEVRSTVLKVGHHGSSSSNGIDWLKAVSPAVAVISCGANNMYGHPATDVLESLKSLNTKVYRTDLQGFLKVSEEEDGSLLYRIQKNATIDVFAPVAAPANETGAPVNDQSGGGQNADDQSGGGQITNATTINRSTPSSEESYVLNTNTMKFHRPGCPSADKIKPKNKEYVTRSREDILQQGYSPCKNCNP